MNEEKIESSRTRTALLFQSSNSILEFLPIVPWPNLEEPDTTINVGETVDDWGSMEE